MKKLMILMLALVPGLGSFAADPASATIGLPSAPATWHGTALGGGALNDPSGEGLCGNEDVCQEGVTCDTFTLTVAGAPTEWVTARKRVHVHLGWTVQGE